MNIKAIVTVVFLLIAGAGLVYVLMGGDGVDSAEHGADCTPSADCPPECAANTATSTARADELPADGVVVYYFHGNKRCYTCNKMEDLAAAVIGETFGDRQADGSVLFRSVNIETDAHRHFVDDFALEMKMVVMVERKDGQDLTWRKLDLVWQKIGEDEAYRTYIAENLTACLDHLAESAG